MSAAFPEFAFALPLSMQANAAWTLAYKVRRKVDWGRMLNAEKELLRYARAPHPRIRKLAADLPPRTTEVNHEYF